MATETEKKAKRTKVTCHDIRTIRQNIGNKKKKPSVQILLLFAEI